MRIYISGAIGTPIDGKTREQLKESFDAMEVRLVAAGHEVVNPHTVLACSPIPDGACGKPVNPSDEQSHSWLCYMKYDIRAMMTCDAVLALCHAKDSVGAKVELSLATALGMPIWTEYYETGPVYQTSGPVTVAGLGLL